MELHGPNPSDQMKKAWTLSQIAMGISPVVLSIPKNGVSQQFDKMHLLQVSAFFFPVTRY